MGFAILTTYNIPFHRLESLDNQPIEPSGNEIFAESDSECGGQIFATSSDSDANDGNEVFFESDSSLPEVPCASSRPYRKRSTDQQTLLGKTVCTSAHQRLMGIGTCILQNLRKGEAVFTNRAWPKVPRHPGVGLSMRASPREKWQYVLCFLWLLYHSAAEVLPTKFRMPNGYLKEEIEGDDEEEFLVRYVGTFMQNREAYHNMPHLQSIGPGSFEGPRRFLQHRKPSV